MATTNQTFAVIRDWTQLSAPSADSNHVLRGRVFSQHRTRKAALRALHQAQLEAAKLPPVWRPSMAAIAVTGQDSLDAWGVVL